MSQIARDGLEVGSSGGDQEMVLAEAGPATDRRPAVRPARDDGSPGLSHQYLNFAILEERFGPSSQPPARLAICVTYYDDPALTGARFKPEVYGTERNGVAALGFTPDSFFVALEGTDRWREAYWEITDMKFTGVNQSPQAAARFFLSDKVFFSRVRYAVIRPCGPNADKNLLAGCKPVEAPAMMVSQGADNTVAISWPAVAEGFRLESSSSVTGPIWLGVTTAPTVEGDRRVVRLQTGATTFYRLVKPE